MTNKEKFLELVSNEKVNTLENARERVKNRAMLRESQLIALKILKRLDELGWSQKYLGERMKVSPQQISKMVSGKENFTIDTLLKIQNILEIPILASYYEQNESGEKLKSRMSILLEELSIDSFSEEVDYSYPTSTSRQIYDRKMQLTYSESN